MIRNMTYELGDEKLIRFYLNNNPSALATLTDLFKDRIYGRIYTMVNDKHIAEDIFRDVFVAIVNNLMIGKIAEDGNFLQWSMQLAQQLCLDYRRKNKLAIMVDTNGNLNAEPIPNRSLSPAISSATYYECHHKLREMIDLLPETQREVIALNHYAGISFKDIAERLQCSVTTALDIMKTGLNNLREMMLEKEIAV